MLGWCQFLKASLGLSQLLIGVGLSGFVVISTLLLSKTSAQGQFSYAGGMVIENFDSLPSVDKFDFSDFGVAKGPAQLSVSPLSATDAAGWGIHARVGVQLLFLVGQGSVGTASVYSFGQHADEDRALGALGGSGQVANLGWRLTNDTGQTLTSFSLSFFAEQWRNGGTASLAGFSGEYRLTNTGDVDSGTYTAIPSMDAPAVSAVSGISFAMNGNSPNNRTERSMTLTGLNWMPDQMLILRWRDLDEVGADNGLAIDDVIFHAPVTALLPGVQAVTPAHGDINVVGHTPVVLVFNQPVSALGIWFEIAGNASGTLAATVTNAGPMRYTLTPITPWPSGETITLRVSSSQIVNGDGQAMAEDYTLTFSTLASSTTVTRMSTVQGSDGYSPLTGAVLTVQGVVVADFQGMSPALGGFYVQEEDADADGNALTSEALWIGDSATDVSVGDVVQVTGEVSESESLTQLVSVSAINVEGTAVLPAVTSVALPMGNTASFERFEGMRVSFSQTLSVTNNSGGTGTTDGFSRFGELLLSSNGPLVTPTEFMDPNDLPASGVSTSGRTHVAAIHDYERQMELRSVILDDSSAAHWPDPTPYLNAQGTRRCGDTVSGLVGILTYATGAYRVQPTSDVTFVEVNPRLAAPPAMSGRLTVAAMNALNYFTTFGGTNDRGASDASEFQRQKDKIIPALAALDADVLGLMEIQNSTAAGVDLLSALNASVSDPYAIVPDPIGGYPLAGVTGDYIRCLLLYRPSKVSLAGVCYMDTDVVWSTPNPLRFPLAQLFQERSTGERFLVCMNHWKSKSSSGASGLNVDRNDGQASFTETRRQQAARLHDWLQGITIAVGDNDLLIMGDLNSNGEEDPLDVLRASGYADQGRRFHSEDYSYRLNGLRGRLDHAFASTSMQTQILGNEHWHINADEPAFYDYKTENKSAAQLLINAGTPFRSSDHDPILVGVSLSPQPTTYEMWVASREWAVGAQTAPEADAEGDGMKNIVEFLLNSDPTLTDAALTPFAEISPTGQFQLSYRRRSNAVGISVQPQWSDDLIDWFPMTEGTPVTIDSLTDLVPVSVPASSRGRLFGRLRVEMAP